MLKLPHISAILHNPYHYCGAIIARVSVNIATIIWSLVVLANKDALAPTPYGELMTRYVHEDVWAAFFLAIASLMLYRIIRKSRPHAVGIIGYLILLIAWGYVEIVMLLVQRPFFPTAVATVSVITVLALYGFVANPRTRDVAA